MSPRRLTGSDARAAAAVEAMSAETGQGIFPKYLTSSQLVNLQMRDPSLRRHVLLQFVILFHFLLGPLNDKQRKKVHAGTKQLTEKVQHHLGRVRQLLESTPPNGHKFLAEVDRFIERENNWVAWKHEKPPCPKLVKVRLTCSHLFPGCFLQANSSPGFPQEAASLRKRVELPEDAPPKAKKQKSSQKSEFDAAAMGLSGSAGLWPLS